MKPLLLVLALLALSACSDDDNFTTSPSARLTFSADTIDMDTVFSTVPTPTRNFWVHNYNDDGLRLSGVRLRRGNQTGFRVNVDGSFLDGSATGDLEVRGGDSIRVFVELTSPLNGDTVPKRIEDDLVFTLQSGIEQSVRLRAHSWDAEMYDSLIINSDTTLASTRPVIIRRGIRIAEGAALTILAPTRLYFSATAGMEVFGSLNIQGRAGQDVILRGDRTDRMFPYLPYDRVSGQWQGIHLHSTSTANTIEYADIHSGSYGLRLDSAAYDSITPRLSLRQTTIHNCSGAGIEAKASNIEMINCQVSNTAGDCVSITGGRLLMAYCTLAQFYPFTAEHGAALRFSNHAGPVPYPLYMLECHGSLITGYADDVLFGENENTDAACNYLFARSVIRTPQPEPLDTLIFNHITWERPADAIQGKAHFRLIDEDNLIYDFRLDSLSTARRAALPLEGITTDRNGKPRTDTPDAGCYQY